MAKVNVRYVVTDVDAALGFYRDQLGFQVDMHPAPGFARVSKGDLQLLLNRPGAGGAGQDMPDGQAPAPGGWNRIPLEVEDLVAEVERLKKTGCRFRNEIVQGNGGKQILLEDPSGNPIELFEPNLRPPALATKEVGEMLKMVLALTLASAPSLGLAAAAHSGWQVLADCSAAYRANSQIADPDRAPSMKAMISEEADDYAKAATGAYRRHTKASADQAGRAVQAYVAKRVPDFAGQPRLAVEHVIDACPQVGG
jgi:catechol 2,3-dioxygenase-like lactoylglutathione lyase family enzyme